MADEPVREFEVYTSELYRMADWLVRCGVETVAMELNSANLSGLTTTILADP